MLGAELRFVVFKRPTETRVEKHHPHHEELFVVAQALGQGTTKTPPLGGVLGMSDGGKTSGQTHDMMERLRLWHRNGAVSSQRNW